MPELDSLLRQKSLLVSNLAALYLYNTTRCMFHRKDGNHKFEVVWNNLEDEKIFNQGREALNHIQRIIHKHRMANYYKE